MVSDFARFPRRLEFLFFGAVSDISNSNYYFRFLFPFQFRFLFRFRLRPSACSVFRFHSFPWAARRRFPGGGMAESGGYLAGTAVFGAVIRDHTPEGRAGMFQGLRIAGQVLIPGLVGPAIGAWVLRDAETVIGDDGTESFIPNQNIFLAALIAAAVLGLFLALLLYIMKKKTAKESDHE